MATRRIAHPFPLSMAISGKPTSVNNVETLCCVARILEMGSGWFSSMGSTGSTGTKLLSISGDCTRRGVYEVPFGTPLREVFDLCGASDPIAVQMGGPSGQMIGPEDFDRTICFDDLATGGSLMIFNRTPQSPRDRFSVHGVLYRRELRLLHAVPSRQRASERETRQDPGRSRRGVGSDLSRGAGRIRSRPPVGVDSVRPRLTPCCRPSRTSASSTSNFFANL